HITEDQQSATERLRRGLAQAGIDCKCREKAYSVLDEFDAERQLQRRAAALADARQMRDAIVVVLALLGEVDELTIDEPDLSAFAELASLFEDVADFASSGADAMRHLSQGSPVPPAKARA